MLHARSRGENGHKAKRLTAIRAASREEKRHRSDSTQSKEHYSAMMKLLILSLSLTLALLSTASVRLLLNLNPKLMLQHIAPLECCVRSRKGEMCVQLAPPLPISLPMCSRVTL